MKYVARLLRGSWLAVPTVLVVLTTANHSAADATAPRITAETVVRYLQQDLFLSPGIGFKRVRIGYGFDRVKATWGPANQVSGGGSTTRAKSAADDKVEWTYIAGPSSQVTLYGSNKVKEIEVRGSFNSPFASKEGATFGMTPHQVISIYGPPTNPRDLTRMIYSSKGIAFGFDLGALSIIKVFRPRESSSPTSAQQPIK